MSLPARAIARCLVEDVRCRGGGQWYGGPGGGRRLEAASSFPVPVANAAGRSGVVRTGEWPDRREAMTRNDHWLARLSPRTVDAMQSITPPGPDRHLGSLMGGTVLGASLVTAGLGLAFLAIDTPLIAGLIPASRSGSPQMAIAPMVWTLAIIAGAALLVAGANRLAITVAAVRSRSHRTSPILRALEALAADIVVATGGVPRNDRPIAALIVGPFGVAVVHEMGPSDRIRRVGPSWEARTVDGWVPTEHPLDRVAREAERVRHRLTHGDLDFVVRVHAALVTQDSAMPRSPLCAVIAADQIPAWIAALPPQRSLSAGRRHRLLARIQEPVSAEDPRRDW